MWITTKIKSKLKIKGKEYDLLEYYKPDNNDKFEIQNKDIAILNNMPSYLKVISLIGLSGISEWNTIKAQDMPNMFKDWKH